jgi:hypothetical protein
MVCVDNAVAVVNIAVGFLTGERDRKSRGRNKRCEGRSGRKEYMVGRK